MQNLICKILLAFFVMVLPTFTWAQNSESNNDLMLADSLFSAKKYTESFELYSSILTKDQQYSQGMLLKMAFIKEGLGDFSQALYYLNLYYSKTSDKRALRKMETLARQYELQGYQFSDMEFFQTIYKRFSIHIILALLSLALFTFSMILWQKKKQEHRPVASGILFVLVLAVLFGLINFGQERSKAIILTDQAYVRKAPSSGADVVGLIGKGNRVVVLSKEDVWVKITWDEKPVYIRESHLAEIES